MIFYELMFPFCSRFGVAFPQIFNVIVYQNLTLSCGTSPADQFGFFEVCHSIPANLSIHSSAPFFVGLQINQPYFIVTVRYNNLLRTDHFDSSGLTPHYLPKKVLSVSVGVEKNKFTFNIVGI